MKVSLKKLKHFEISPKFLLKKFSAPFHTFSHNFCIRNRITEPITSSVIQVQTIHASSSVIDQIITQLKTMKIISFFSYENLELTNLLG